jgi:hypothetical protein
MAASELPFARVGAVLDRYRRPLLLGMSVGGVILAVGLFLKAGTPGFDLYAYWAVDPLDPYGATGGLGAFHYSPVLAVAFLPLKLLPWPAVYWVWFAFLFAVLVWLTRSWALASLLYVPIALELYEGNIHLLIAAAVVLGLRWPAAWSFLLLTKITPGVTVVWFAVRREWRKFLITFAWTVTFVVASVIVMPEVWRSWLVHLTVAEPITTPNQIPVPLLVRLPIAVLVIAWGARTNRPWTLAVGTTLALPVLWFHGLAVLAAIPALLDARRTRADPVAGWFGGLSLRPKIRRADPA